MAQNIVWKYQTPLIGETLAAGIAGGIRPGLPAPVSATVDRNGICTIQPFSLFLRPANRTQLLVKVDQVDVTLLTLGIAQGFVGMTYSWANDAGREAEFEVHPMSAAQAYPGVILFCFTLATQSVWSNLADFTDSYWLSTASGTGLFLRPMLPREPGFDFNTFLLADYRGPVSNYTLMYQLILDDTTVLKAAPAVTRISLAGREAGRYYLLGWQNKYVQGQVYGLGELSVIGEGSDSVDGFETTFNYQLLAVVRWTGSSQTSTIHPVLGMVPSGSASVGANTGSFDNIELPSAGNLDTALFRTYGEPGTLVQQRRLALTTPWDKADFESEYTPDGALSPLLYNDPRLMVTNAGQVALDGIGVLEGRAYRPAGFDPESLLFQEWWHMNTSPDSNHGTPSSVLTRPWPQNRPTIDIAPVYSFYPTGYGKAVSSWSPAWARMDSSPQGRPHMVVVDMFFRLDEAGEDGDSNEANQLWSLVMPDLSRELFLETAGPQPPYNGLPSFDPDENRSLVVMEVDSNVLVPLENTTLIKVNRSGVLIEFTNPVVPNVYVKVENHTDDDQLIMIYDRLDSFPVPAGGDVTFTVSPDGTDTGDVFPVDTIMYNVDEQDILYSVSKGSYAGLGMYVGPELVAEVDLGADLTFDAWHHFSIQLVQVHRGLTEVSRVYFNDKCVGAWDAWSSPDRRTPTSPFFFDADLPVSAMRMEFSYNAPKNLYYDEVMVMLYAADDPAALPVWTMDEHENPSRLEWASVSYKDPDRRFTLLYDGDFVTNIFGSQAFADGLLVTLDDDPRFRRHFRSLLAEFGVLHPDEGDDPAAP